jgi:hypothetical protein
MAPAENTECCRDRITFINIYHMYPSSNMNSTIVLHMEPYEQNEGLDFRLRTYPALIYFRRCNQLHLGFADSEHLGATGRTNALGSRLAVLHGYSLGIFHLFLGPAFYTIGFHTLSPFTRFALRVNSR